MSQEAYNQGADQAAQDPTILSRIGSLADTAVNALQETYYNYRNRAVAAIAVGATALGVTAAMETAIDVTPAGALGEAASPTFVSTTVRTKESKKSSPMLVSQMIDAADYYYRQKIDPESTQRFNLTTMQIADHLFVRAGDCSSNPNSSINSKMERLNLQGDFLVSCTKVGGHYQTYTLPRKRINPYWPAAKAVDFIPLTKEIGDKAAQTVGEGDQHGEPSQIKITKSSATEVATIQYRREHTTNGTKPKGLKELVITERGKGKETVHKVWYR